MKITTGRTNSISGVWMNVTRSRESTRFVRFAMVGVIGAVVDFGAFNILNTFTPMSAIWAQTFSFILAVLSNFTWNRFWTYPDSRSKAIPWQLVQFFVVNTIGWAIRTPIFAVIETPLRNFFAVHRIIPIFSADFLGHNLALAIAVLVVMMWNYFINRYWTYGDV